MVCYTCVLPTWIWLVMKYCVTNQSRTIPETHRITFSDLHCVLLVSFLSFKISEQLFNEWPIFRASEGFPYFPVLLSYSAIILTGLITVSNFVRSKQSKRDRMVRSCFYITIRKRPSLRIFCRTYCLVWFGKWFIFPRTANAFTTRSLWGQKLSVRE